MVDHWSQNGPPVYVSVAGYLGLIKKRSPKTSKKGGNLNELVQMFKGSGGMIQ